MEQKLITDLHKSVISLNTQAFHPKKYIRRRVTRNFLPRLSGLVLDVGCGRGEDPPFMINARRIIGYDLDAEILKHYKEINNTDAIAGDGMIMPFCDNSVDSISCIDVLEHIPDYKKTISEAYRVLKKGGLLVISVPTDPSLFTSKDEEIGHLRLFDRKELIRDIKEAKFSIETARPYGTLIYPYVKHITNRMSVKKIHDVQTKKSFGLFKIIFNLLIKPYLNLDYYVPQPRDIGLLIVAVKS
ncbi:class I SAM-dependent methyltransferase [Candidatus Omnitrophota bacterium]